MVNEELRAWTIVSPKSYTQVYVVVQVLDSLLWRDESCTHIDLLLENMNFQIFSAKHKCFQEFKTYLFYKLKVKQN